MKKLSIFLIILLTTLVKGTAQEFTIVYDDAYSLTFQPIDTLPGEVAITDLYLYRDVHGLDIPAKIEQDGKIYTVSAIQQLNEHFSATGKLPKLFGTLTLPKTIRSINSLHCSIDSLIIYDAPIEVLDYHAFGVSVDFGCLNLKYVDFGNAIKMVGGFYDCKSLESIKLPESAKSFTKEAFSGCTALKTAIIPASVTNIPREAFMNCTALESVTFYGENTAPINIEESIFYGCESLKEISLPAVSRIPQNMFRDCHSIKAIAIADLPVDDEFNLPTISSRAFENCYSLTSLSIPPVYGSIESNAFANCRSLSSFTIPATVSNYWLSPIHASAFAGCSGIKEFVVEKGNKSLTAENGVIYYKREGSTDNNRQLILYPAGKTATSFKVPSDVQIIVSGVFEGAVYLKQVEIPDNVTSILSRAFANCTALTEVRLPAKLEYVPYGIFSGCRNLKKVEIPDAIKYISGTAFEQCASLPAIKLPASLMVLGNSAFYGCSSLDEITVPQGVERIDLNTFRDCSALKTLNLPDGVTSIGMGAMSGCTSLAGFAMPARLDSIHDRAFMGCTSLTEVTLPDGLRHLGMSAFEGCTAVRSVSTGNGLRELGDFAFLDNTALTRLTLGSSLRTIGDDAFAGDDAITEIICLSAEPAEYFTGFSQTVIEQVSLTVPDGAEDRYAVTYPWSQIIEWAGVEPVADTRRPFTVDGGILLFDDPQARVEVYTISGTLTARGTGRIDRTLPAGMYIVTVNSVPYKLAIR